MGALPFLLGVWAVPLVADLPLDFAVGATLALVVFYKQVKWL